MRCKRFKMTKAGRRCADFAGARKRKRGRRRAMRGLGGLHTIGGVKFKCSAYGRGPSGELRCARVSGGGGPPINRPSSAKRPYAKARGRKRYKGPLYGKGRRRRSRR